MVGLNHFLTSVSIHFLKYTASPNGYFIRLVWVLVILIAFAICGYIVQQNVEDNAKDPIATAIKNEPISKFPFPSITVKPKRFKLDEFGALENVLNYFTFDCTGAGLNPEDDKAQCVEDSLNVRKEFPLQLNKAIRYSFENVYHKLVKSKTNMHLLAANLLCTFILNSHQAKINKAITKLLVQNDTIPFRSIFKIYKDNYLFPLVDNADKIVHQLEDLMTEETKLLFEENPIINLLHYDDESWCKNSNFELINPQISRPLLSLAIAMGDSEMPVPLGSFLLQMKAHNFHEARTNEIYKARAMLDEIIDDTFGTTNISALRHVLTCTWNCNNSTYVLKDKHDQKNAVNAMSLHYYDSIQEGLPDIYHNLALKLASKMGLPARVVSKSTAPVGVPMVWHCSNDGKMLEGCFQFKSMYTNRGIGAFSMKLNSGEWNDYFKFDQPFANYMSPSRELSLNAKQDIMFYIQSGKFKG